MDTNSALAAFAALSQETRLATLKRLIVAGPKGSPAGQLAEALEVPHNTLSTHLKALEAAGLVGSERQGRRIVYRARYETLRSLLGYLMVDCCRGLPEIVGDLPGCADPACQPSEGASL
ncbi:MAG: metalloregulator ArsR/SmtB family transcription factor [Pseudomonadota bacterium]